MTYLSVVVPIYNEYHNLDELTRRIVDAAGQAGESFEIIYVDDGSTDGSWEKMEETAARYPGVVRLIGFNRNYGQHMAVMAGFERVRGQVIVTLDADLQNPPEEIGRLVAKLEEGWDIVAGWREERRDTFWRRWPSLLVNIIASRVVGVSQHDYGCMLRAYRREIVDQLNMCSETTPFIPALANTFARRVTEIKVAHSGRSNGRSKYGLMRLIRLNFDLMTGFSLFPLHLVSLLGAPDRLSGAGIRCISVRAPPGGGGPRWRAFSRSLPFSSCSSGSRSWSWACWGNISAGSSTRSGARPRYIIRRMVDPDRERGRQVGQPARSG